MVGSVVPGRWRQRRHGCAAGGGATACWDGRQLMRRSLPIAVWLLASVALLTSAPGAESEQARGAAEMVVPAEPKVSITSFVALVSHPLRIIAGPDGALWFTNAGNNSIGRISPRGKVTRFTHMSIDKPRGITVGPDGALWFTNRDSIGRISTSGKVTGFRHASIRGPHDIAAGPDGALWFTNGRGDSIGRITTGGAVTNFRDAGIHGPRGIIARAGRRPLVHQQRQLDRTDHDRREVTIFYDASITVRGGSPRGRTAPSGSPTTGLTRSGGSPPAARSPASGMRASRPAGDRCWAGRRPLVHELRQRLDRADHDRRHGHELQVPRARASAAREGSPLGRTARSGSPTTAATRSGGSPPAARSELPARRHPLADGIAPGPDGALWFANEGSESIGRITTGGTVTNFRHASIHGPWGITLGRTAPSGSPTGTPVASGHTVQRRARNSIGRITTGGTVTSFRHASIRGPFGIAPGRDGASGSPTTGATRSGGSPPRGTVKIYTGRGIRGPAGDHAGPDGALWFTNARLDRADHHQRQDQQLQGREHPAGPWGIAAGPDGALWFTNYRGNSIGRITTNGKISSFTGTRASAVRRGSPRGPDGALWFTNNRQRLDRADHHRRQGQQLPACEHRRAVGDHRGAGRRPLVHQRWQRLDRADSDSGALMTESTIE